MTRAPRSHTSARSLRPRRQSRRTGVDPRHATAAVEQDPCGSPGPRQLVRPAWELNPAHHAAAARATAANTSEPRRSGGRPGMSSASPLRSRPRPLRRRARPLRAAASARGAGHGAAVSRRAGRRARRCASSPPLCGRSAGALASAAATTSSRAGGSSAARAGARRRLVEVRVEHGELAPAIEGRLAGQALVEHTAERVDVGRPSTPVPSICSGAM